MTTAIYILASILGLLSVFLLMDGLISRHRALRLLEAIQKRRSAQQGLHQSNPRHLSSAEEEFLRKERELRAIVQKERAKMLQVKTLLEKQVALLASAADRLAYAKHQRGPQQVEMLENPGRFDPSELWVSSNRLQTRRIASRERAKSPYYSLFLEGIVGDAESAASAAKPEYIRTVSLTHKRPLLNVVKFPVADTQLEKGSWQKDERPDQDERAVH